MRNLNAAAGALALALSVLALSGARADEKAALAPAVPDATLPFNPVDGAVVGDWAQYDVTDPGSAERFPEVFATRAIEGGEVVLVDKMTETFRYKSGEAGRSATAFLRGFFGVSAEPFGLRGLTVTAEPVEVRGRRYASAVRLDATVARPMANEDPKTHAPAEMRTEVSIWLAPGVRAPGVVKAVATVTLLGDVRRGRIELTADGAAATPMPRLDKNGEVVVETPTAAPATTSPTAATRKE
jgi:hypothetical protein